MINGISWLVVTKLDVLDEMNEIPVCTAYKIDGKKTIEIPAQASGYEKIECMYKKLPGWRTSTQDITQFEKLPKAAREYLAFVERESGARVGVISTGPGREQTIFIDEFLDRLKNAPQIPIAMQARQVVADSAVSRRVSAKSLKAEP